MILYPLVYGSFPWSGGYDFHPSNIGRDGKTLKLPFDTSNMSKGDIESVLRQCSSESWFTRRLSNDWFLIGHTYNSIDAHNRPSNIVYSLLVSPDIIDNIWDFYFTTKENGSGIGLAVCKKIMEAQKGTITVKNIKASTEFRLEFTEIKV